MLLQRVRNFWLPDGNHGTPREAVDPQQAVQRKRPQPKQKPDPISAEDRATLCKALACWYVRKEAKFYRVDNTASSFSRADLERAAIIRFRTEFPDILHTSDLLREVFQHAIDCKHDDPEQTIQVWNGTQTCRPDVNARLIPEDGFVAINAWKRPNYRSLGVGEADDRLLDALLERVFTHAPDRRVFKDWLAWCLQNEADKPGWAIMLYSRRKGTGKSSLCRLVGKLFGAENSFTQNGIEQLTGRFNMPLLASKLIVSEEIKLTPGSKAGNTLKSYITEKETAAEFKGKDVQRVRQCCCLLFTSNNMPHWIEADDRRYYVIDCDHDGHAAGPEADGFAEFMHDWLREIEDDTNVAKIYNALLRHQLANDFDPRRLNLARQSNPLMQGLQDLNGDVLVDRVREYLEGADVRAVPQQKLAEVFQVKFKANANQIRHVMPELSWSHQKVKWGGVDHARALWVKPEHWVDRGDIRGPEDYRLSIADEAEKLQEEGDELY